MRLMLAAFLASISVLIGASANAMDFVLAGTDIRDDDANWIQAEGPIDDTTVEEFIAFVEEGPDWLPRRIRFNSPGGNLRAGIRLGEELRRRGFATEVGGHEPHPDFLDMTSWDFTRRTPGMCASACAYAFMGGVERRIDPGSRIGVHQFYSTFGGDSNMNGKPVLVPEGEEQKVVSVLLDYVLRMGVDGRVLVNAGLSSKDEMYWITPGSNASATGLSYAPTRWSDWDIHLLGKGVIAESERADGKYKMAALCTERDGAFFDLFIIEEPGGNLKDWLVDQCLPAGSWSQGQGAHSILGNRVDVANIRIVDRPGGFGVRFALGHSPTIQGHPSFLSGNDSMGACSTQRFLGNETNMRAAIQIAFRNCIQ